ncbi:MAG: hypothetical protein LIO99_13560 [Clostridiales bacterium]|nr:hypothetical protein [Clostridiales bacterium]
MSEQKVQSGYIECLDKPYTFTYDGELLWLVPKDKDSIQPYDCLRNRNEYYKVLEGVNQKFKKIFFLNCVLHVSSSGYIAKPAGFICFENGIDAFDVITFKGGIIDFFYRTNQIVDEEKSNSNCDTGESIIRLKSFDDTTKYCNVIIDGKKAKLMLSITLPVLPLCMKVNYNLGKPETVLRLIFGEEAKASEFRNIYMWIYNLMTFLNFRRDVGLGKIELGKINEKDEVVKVAYAYILEKDKTEIEDIDKIIGYYFVENYLDELLQIVNKPDLNLLFIPPNKKVDKDISPEQYIVCCTSFESVFNHTFPNAKLEYSQKANEVKEELFEYIDRQRELYKGKDGKKRKELKKYANIIKQVDFGLGEKFEHCQEIYKNVVDSYMQRMKYKLSFSKEEYENIAQYFAEKRNMLIHNSLGDFEDIHIVAYSLARVFIYAMILKSAGLEEAMLIQAIEKVL